MHNLYQDQLQMNNPFQTSWIDTHCTIFFLISKRFNQQKTKQKSDYVDNLDDSIQKI